MTTATKCLACGIDIEPHPSDLCDSCETQAAYDREASHAEARVLIDTVLRNFSTRDDNRQKADLQRALDLLA